MVKKYLTALFFALSIFNSFGANTSTNLDNTVTINESVLQDDPTNGGPILFRVEFDEAVSGFTGADIDFTGSTVSGTLTASVTPINGSLYSVSVSGMTSSGVVIASVVAGAATLDSDGSTLTAASTSSDNEVTYDIDDPIANSLTPLDDAINVSISSNLVISFNEDVDKGSGNIEIRNYDTDALIQSISIGSGVVSVSGSDVTINPNNFPSETHIYVIIPASGFDDEVGNSFAGITNKDDWDFVTVNAPPQISSLNPTDGANGVSINVNQVVITFSEEVVNVGDNSNADNNIRIHEIGGADIETINPQAVGRVTISGAGNNIVTITLTATLSPSTDYSVRIGNSVFEDLGGLAFSGTDNNTSWNFETESGPSITTFSSDPTCVGEIITINGSGFGVSVPTVTVNGQPAVVSGYNGLGTTINITVPNTVQGTVEVTNNDNSLMATDLAGFAINPAMNSSLPINASPPTSYIGNSTNILLNNSQDGVTYQLRKTGGPTPPSNGAIGSSDVGDGTQLSFNTTTFTDPGGPGTYTYIVRGTRSGCTTVNLGPINVEVSAFSVNAGNDITICAGDSVKLGADPTIGGGSGFYMTSWDTEPATGIFSTATNPVVSPSATTTYRITVQDGPSGPILMDDVTITVNDPEDPANFEIQFDPTSPDKTYINTDPPVELTYTLNGIPGNYVGATRFEGPGVSSAGTTKYFFPNAANIGSSNIITLVYEDISTGCTTEISDQVFVRDKNPYLTNLANEYCQVDQNITNLTPVTSIYYPPTFTLQIVYTYINIFGVNIAIPSIVPISVRGRRYTFINDIRLNDLAVPANNPIGAPSFSYTPGLNPILNTDQLSPGAKQFEMLYNIIIYDYNFADPANPIELSNSNSYVPVKFNIKAKPILTPRYPAEVCQNDAPFGLIVEPFGGNYSINSIPQGLAANFDPGNPGYDNPPNSNSTVNIPITYVYTDPSSQCTNTHQGTVAIKRFLPSDLLFTNSCEGDTVLFQTALAPGEVSKYQIAFGDNSFVREESGNDMQFEHHFIDPKEYDVVLTTSLTNGCEVSYPKTLLVGKNPKFSFSWENVCEGQTSQFNVQLQTPSFIGSEVSTMIWDFGDASQPDTTNSYVNSTTHAFGQGKRITSLSIESTTGCTITKTLETYTVPFINGPLAVTGNTPYSVDFDTNDGGWIAGGTNASWEWGLPNNSLIDSDFSGSGAAWVTDLESSYNDGEKSWVHSPCFDLTNLERPVLSMVKRLLTDERRDGAVIQVNITNETDENDWTTVGNTDSGLNWYNSILIQGAPGGQIVGWSGTENSTTWETTAVTLDDFLPSIGSIDRAAVRFRVAFGSETGKTLSPELEGFAFDNFRIDERTRIVLVEQFTNSESQANKNSNVEVNSFIGTPKTTNEIVKIEYHLGFPGPEVDPLYLDNKADANARAAYYGITETPSTRMDAKTGSSAFSVWSDKIFDEQTLAFTKFSIDTIFVEVSIDDSVSIHVRFTPLQNFAENENVVLHIVPVEKVIKSSDTDSATYVMKQMLPSALGTKFLHPLDSGESYLTTVDWFPTAYDINQLAIIAFLQNEETREVYQARILSALNEIPPVNIITAIEPDFVNQIRVYPNPADDELTVELPAPLLQPIPVKLYDTYGREVYYSAIEAGARSKMISTQNLASGVYILQMDSKEGSLLRKKVLVVH